MLRPLPADVADLFPPLPPSTVERVGHVLQGKANALFARPELGSASFALTELAEELRLDPLTVLRATLHSPFDRAGCLRFFVGFRDDELRIDVLRFPVVVPGPALPTTAGARGPPAPG
eukprot:2636432-Alexandrium_andersonii.AAC.1